ncbi:hypothetical protein [Acinetobacter haemolyticus]|uniref:hypothetical protein n=1 Tax=Acinetobacter haemolyticus TaxID=29430 RepID=UPI0021CDA756|nr:hypothetical protein [Acinetobacter haemolyticus]MCU4380038.1 hypothetical protein [Acinetobacter haemolyticus]
MNKNLIGILLTIISTHTLAQPKKFETPKGEENKFQVWYDTKNKKINGASTLDQDKIRREKCADMIYSDKVKKELEQMAKGKTGIVQLTYYCRH